MNSESIEGIQSWCDGETESIFEDQYECIPELNRAVVQIETYYRTSEITPCTVHRNVLFTI